MYCTVQLYCTRRRNTVQLNVTLENYNNEVISFEFVRFVEVKIRFVQYVLVHIVRGMSHSKKSRMRCTVSHACIGIVHVSPREACDSFVFHVLYVVWDVTLELRSKPAATTALKPASVVLISKCFRAS